MRIFNSFPGKGATIPLSRLISRLFLGLRHRLELRLQFAFNFPELHVLGLGFGHKFSVSQWRILGGGGTWGHPQTVDNSFFTLSIPIIDGLYDV